MAKKHAQQEMTAAIEAETTTTKRGHDRYFYVQLKTLAHSTSAPSTEQVSLIGFKKKTELNEYLASNPEHEVVGDRLIRGYAIPLKQTKRVSF